MNDLSLVTTEALVNEIRRRQNAKDITYIMGIATDNGEGWDIWHNLCDEQIDDLMELLTGDDGWEYIDEDGLNIEG